MITDKLIRQEILDYIEETGDLRGACCLYDDLKKLQRFLNEEERIG